MEDLIKVSINTNYDCTIKCSKDVQSFRVEFDGYKVKVIDLRIKEEPKKEAKIWKQED